MNKPHKGIWVAYILSCFTPFTCLISGVIAIVYAGYRLDKNEDGEVVNSHYYGLIRTFFLNLTFFVVLIVTVATANGVLVGVSDYWYKSTMLDKIAYAIPYVGMCFAFAAIILWFVRMYRGMKQLKNNQPLNITTGPNL
ncbi:membrane protein [Vibrio mexicanus]|uniref:membrane protein n=1 Tax=Vibrio mexicanus TaxID=1004326 RepID=UPI00063C9E95|nr:membrane protein [Vibrio mexicanus]